MPQSIGLNGAKVKVVRMFLEMKNQNKTKMILVGVQFIVKYVCQSAIA